MQQHYPTFSIIVPTYSRPGQLRLCLEALACLKYPQESFEVIVIDDGGEFSIESLVNSFQGQIDVKYFKQEHAGPATARNTGGERAKNEFLAFTDDDCAPAPDWLQRLASRFEDFPDHGIGGRILNSLPENVYSEAGCMLTDYLYEYYRTSKGQVRFFASNNLAFPRKHFLQIGGFNKTFPLPAAEDRELCDRWLRMGFGLTYAPEVAVYHGHDLALRTFWKQHLNYGRGAFVFHQLCPQPIEVEPLSFYLKLLQYPFTQSRKRKIRLSGLFLLSQMANAIGYFLQKRSGTKEPVA